MKKPYSSQFMDIFYDKNKSFVKVIRKKTTEEMQDEDYKTDMAAIRDCIVKNKVQRALLDNSNFHFSISPSLQEWVNDKVIMPSFQGGLRRVAFIIGEDLFAQISSEQTMDEKEAQNLKSNYFEKEDDAMKWLMQ